MDTEDPLRKCDKCKITKHKSVFYRYKYCKKCHIKSYLNNHLNLSIDELNNIMKTVEHDRYDEIVMYFTGHSMRDSSIITNEIIDNFLDENVIPI